MTKEQLKKELKNVERLVAVNPKSFSEEWSEEVLNTWYLFYYKGDEKKEIKIVGKEKDLPRFWSKEKKAFINRSAREIAEALGEWLFNNKNKFSVSTFSVFTL